MNFRNSEILTLRCLEGRKSYRKVESVSKSDKNWICYSDFKKKSLPEKESGRAENAIFQNGQFFDLESRAWYQNVQTSRKVFEIQIVIASKRANARKLNVPTWKVSIIIFMLR